jgi:Raf kinase inhibitor-like YbhB/YbcL family protein
MKLETGGFADGEWIPERFAFGIPDGHGRMRLGANRNPTLAWQDVPAGAASLILLCYDDDVPARPDDINREDKTIAHDFPRTRFYHWVMVDIPVEIRRIEEGSAADGALARGKRNPAGPKGSRQGLNSYTQFMRGNPDMEGRYFGYDGPCPPWNDERMHRYQFVLEAADFSRCPVEGDFDGAQVEAALKGHVLASAAVTGVYSLFAPLLKKR